jgi:acyl carrier protein
MDRLNPMDERFQTLLRPYLPLLGDEPVTAGAQLRELGLDSMQSVDLLFAVEDEYAVALPDEALNEATFSTAGSLWQAISAASDEGAIA